MANDKIERTKRRIAQEARMWWYERSRNHGLPESIPHPSIYLRGPEGSHPRVPWPAFPPPDYRGQLEPSFQAALRASRSYVAREDCDFYHSSVLSSGEEIRGAWDLRGREHEYSGGVKFFGRRVLDMGPATGHMTFWMENQGASVVAFDVGWDVCVDLLPAPGIDPLWARMEAMKFIGSVQNSWWFLHRDLESKAEVVYGDIYKMPSDIGSYQVAFFGAILLHLRNPFLALAEAASRTTEQIVVTDLLQDPDLDPNENRLRFAPVGSENWTMWWSMTPATVTHMLSLVGFGRSTISYHSQKHHLGHDLQSEAVDMKMFTVVAERT